MAAVPASGEGTRLSFRSGAMLWCIRRTERGPIEVTSPHRGRGRPGIQRHYAELPSDEVTVHDGIPPRQWPGRFSTSRQCSPRDSSPEP
jgi:hypothetical protein